MFSKNVVEKMSLWPVNNSIKCVVVGDGCVGKTCLLISYALNKFPSDHVPTVFDSYACTVMAGEEAYSVCLFDTAGQEEYDRLRVLAYPGSDVFLVCFSLVEPSSLQNVSQVWVPEIKKHCGEKALFFLVGTKQDLRTDMQTIQTLQKKKEKPVTWEQGNKVAKAVGAEGYIECSALTQKGLRDVFNEALLAVLEPSEKSKPKPTGLRRFFKSCVKVQN